MTPRKNTKTTPTDEPCKVCGGANAKIGPALNGLPENIPTCDHCREAVKARQVGVTINPDGTLSITDGRKPADMDDIVQGQAALDGAALCESQYEVYTCTLPMGHDGAHEAVNPDNGEVLATWEPNIVEAAPDDALPPTDETAAADVSVDLNRPAGEQAEAANAAPLSEAIAQGMNAAATAPATVQVLEADWERIMALLGSVENARAQHNDAKEEASRAKKNLEAVQEALERALDRVRAGKTASQEPTLPFDAPAPPGVPEPSPDGLPFEGVHQSDVQQPDSNIGRLVHFNHEADDAAPWKIVAEGSIEGQPLVELEGMSGEFGLGLFRFADGATYDGPPTLPDVPSDVPADAAPAEDVYCAHGTPPCDACITEEERRAAASE